MHADSIANPTPTRTSLLWQLALLACLSASYEALFVYHGVSALDEGWPLYAVSRLLEGGVLYDDVLFVFPPGHLLPAWLGYQLNPPGIIATRVIGKNKVEKIIELINNLEEVKDISELTALTSP